MPKSANWITALILGFMTYVKYDPNNLVTLNA
jgi:hypothetical protein